jgi:hypothetical protein
VGKNRAAKFGQSWYEIIMGKLSQHFVENSEAQLTDICWKYERNCNAPKEEVLEENVS